MKKFLFLFLSMISFGVFAQTPATFGIKFTGFVRTDIFYDSRQIINSRESHFLLYPDNVLIDPTGKDINAKSSFNMLSITSRLKANITAPDVLGAKAYGAIEGEFFGMSDADINQFRLRHAYFKLNWQTTELLVGQYWNPFFIPEAFPLVANFNTGAPFTPITRNPQVRLTQTFGQLRLMVAAISQRDFTSMGPNPADPTKAVSNSMFLRNSALPDFHVQIQYRPNSSENIIGINGDFKTIVPELYTIGKSGAKFSTDEKISSISACAFIKLKFNPVTVKVYAIMAENGPDIIMIGGIAAKELTDSITGHRTWTNLRSAASWLEINTTNKKWNAGLFLGYTKNLGSADIIQTNFLYSLGTKIDYVYRISPRISYTAGNLACSLEFDNTTAAYGTNNNHGEVINAKDVTNLRTLLVMNYNF